MAGASFTFGHLFSFQVCYADPPAALASQTASAGTKILMDAASLVRAFLMKILQGRRDHGGDIVLKRGIFGVDFREGLLTLAKKDKVILSKEFQSFIHKFVGKNNLLRERMLGCDNSRPWRKANSGPFAGEWSHVNWCGDTCSAFQGIFLSSKLLRLDKTVIKAGLLTRTKSFYKVDRRLLILVPGKLFLFKGFDISSKRVRYVTTLARAKVEATHGQPSFRILVPNREALSLAASSVEAAKEWISVLEDSIEYANTQGARSRSKKTAAQISEEGGGGPQPYSGDFIIPHSYCLQLADRTAFTPDNFRMAGPHTQQYYSQPAAVQLDGINQKMYMDSWADSLRKTSPCMKQSAGFYPLPAADQLDVISKRSNTDHYTYPFRTAGPSTQQYHPQLRASDQVNGNMQQRYVDHSLDSFKMTGLCTQENYSQPAAYQLDGITQQRYMDHPLHPFRTDGLSTQEYYSQPAAYQLDGITQEYYSSPRLYTQLNGNRREMSIRGFCTTPRGIFWSNTGHQPYTDYLDGNRAAHGPWSSATK